MASAMAAFIDATSGAARLDSLHTVALLYKRIFL